MDDETSAATRLTGALERPLRSGPSRGDAVTDRLVTALAVGEYLPGSRLPDERTLAASLQVSRAAVREALASLAEAGVVETRRGRGGGSFVLDAHSADVAPAVSRSLEERWSEIVDAIDGVGRLQEAIVRAAAENRTLADMAELDARLESFRSAASGRARQEADAAFHLAICAAAHSQTLTQLLVSLEKRISIVGPAHLWGAPEDHAGMESRALADHEGLVRYICLGEGELGGQLARRHARIDLILLEGVRLRSRAGQGSGTP